MCGLEVSAAERGTYILFLFILSFLKIPYPKTRKKIVLSCEKPFFGIYYINNQRFIHCTIFVQNRTIRTKVHKIAFCTENIDFVPESTAFCTGITVYISALNNNSSIILHFCTKK